MSKIILATSSPRRKELFDKFNIDYQAVESKVSEVLDPRDKPIPYAMAIAYAKAYEVSKQYEDKIVIGADTIVVYKDEILEKPKDEEDAYRMLQLLSGKEHQVISGLAIINLCQNKKVVDYDLTKVKFRDLEPITIRKYIETEEPLDKSGAYGIQGLGGILVESIAGSYYNVIGLPLVKLDELMLKHFNKSLI